MTDTDGKEAGERARAAMVRVGEGLAGGALPDSATDRQLRELAARLDSRLWEPHHPGTSPR